MSQTIARGGPRSQIAIPAQGMIEFRDALTDLLEEFGTDDGGFKGSFLFSTFMIATWSFVITLAKLQVSYLKADICVWKTRTFTLTSVRTIEASICAFRRFISDIF